MTATTTTSAAQAIEVTFVVNPQTYRRVLEGNWTPAKVTSRQVTYTTNVAEALAVANAIELAACDADDRKATVLAEDLHHQADRISYLAEQAFVGQDGSDWQPYVEPVIEEPVAEAKAPRTPRTQRDHGTNRPVMRNGKLSHADCDHDVTGRFACRTEYHAAQAAQAAQG